MHALRVKGDITTNKDRQHDAETLNVDFWTHEWFGIE